jgi:dipeptidase D
MVCEKNAATVHDFAKDPIQLQIDGDILSANNTTLGADNGIAVAFCMALAEDGGLEHPPLEIVLTADEEAGMSGAENLDISAITARRMINLDTSDEGTFYAGCAGGVKAAYILPNQWEEAGDFTEALCINVKGLKGGHSGEEINKERGNSLRILGRLLHELDGLAEMRIGTAQGGMKLNAIPREAEAVIALKPENAEAVTEALNAFAETLAKEYRATDPGLVITCQKADPGRVLAQPVGKALIASLLLLPNGVLAMSQEVEGLVETSCNIGVLEQTEAETVLHIMPRSGVASRIPMVKALISAAAERCGARVDFSHGYNPWEYNPQSALRERAIQVYTELRGHSPKVTSVHAGLECGIFGVKIPGLDIVSFGPDMFEIHTPNEQLSISSTQRVWRLLTALLEAL